MPSCRLPSTSSVAPVTKKARSEQHHTTASAPRHGTAATQRALHEPSGTGASGQQWSTLASAVPALADHSAWTSTPSPADSASQACGSSSPWSALGPHGIRNRWSSAGTSGQRRRTSIAGERPFTVTTLDGEAARRWVRIPPRQAAADQLQDTRSDRARGAISPNRPPSSAWV
jgi:hypothetical protein